MGTTTRRWSPEKEACLGLMLDPYGSFFRAIVLFKLKILY